MWKWIKVPKAIALLAFLLPWMTVSCQGTPMAKANGMQLTLGRFVPLMSEAKDMPSSGVNLFLALAIVAILAGILVSFLMARKGAPIVLGTSVAAVVLIWLGKMHAEKDVLAGAAAKQNPSSGMGADTDNAIQQMQAMIHVDWQWGFWLTLAALIIAAVMAGLVMAGKDTQVTAKLGDLAPDSAADAGGAEPM